MIDPITLHASTALIGPELHPASNVRIETQEGSIVAVTADSMPEEADVRLVGITLIPGFIDAHVHIGLADPREVLLGGVTTVRDLAWPPDRIFPLVLRSRSADFDGPEVLAAGPMLTCLGGYPTRASWAPPGTARVVEDAEDGRQAARERRDEGAAIVKVALNPAVGPTLTEEILRAICDEAHGLGLEVTGHVFGLEELDKALDCGMDELAHMLMSPEEIPDSTMARMVEQGMRVIPTLGIHRGKTRRRAMLNLSGFALAGGDIVYGTDLGNEGPRPGIDPTEIDRMERSEMSPEAIISSATVRAAAAVGLSDRGVIAQGYKADLVGVKGDPIDTPVVLNQVVFVMRAGRVHRLDV